jgi:hypothetical protein
MDFNLAQQVLDGLRRSVHTPMHATWRYGRRRSVGCAAHWPNLEGAENDAQRHRDDQGAMH